MTVQRRVGISVFAVAFAFGLNITGIMPVLGMVSEKYTDIDTSLIQMLQTIPYFLIMFGSLCAGWLASRIDKKKLLMAGLLLVGVCGVLPFLLQSFMVLLVCRILIGFGFGIISPLNTAVIAEFIEPESRGGYLGLHVVGMGVGAMVGNMLGGILAGLGLRYFYLVYGVAFLALLVVGFTLMSAAPVSDAADGVSDSDATGRKTDQTAKHRIRLTAIVYILSVFSFMHTLFINAYNTNISMYISDAITKNPSAAGNSTAINAAFALLSGLIFTRISGLLKRKTLPVSIFAAGLGFLALLFVPGMAGVLICSALCGVSLSCFMAMSAYLISLVVEPDAVAMASSVFSIVGSIGGLVAPIIMGGAAGLLGGNTPIHQFSVASVGMIALGIVASITIARGTGEDVDQEIG